VFLLEETPENVLFFHMYNQEKGIARRQLSETSKTALTRNQIAKL
jgi:hypothetical protein